MSSEEDFFNRKKKELGVKLNEVQQKAVLHTEGPLLLLATPGSGKTTTIIMRIGYLIEQLGVSPSRIKAVTFSKASANDMGERFKRFFPELQMVDFSTIHSFAFRVVRDYFYQEGIKYQLIEGTINTENKSGSEIGLNKKMILRELFQTMSGENITEDQLEELLTYVSFIKNKLLKRDKWSTIPCNVPNAEEILSEYERIKNANQGQLLLDYDDMLTIANRVLEENDQLLLKYQQRYDYILTDESQDTSLVQHSIVEKLVRKHRNLCVVADDDQSIYSWRAAEPQYLINFKNVYPEATILKMEQNYRSSKDIVEVANKFIKRNKKRYEKNMFTDNPPHKPIMFSCFPDYKDQTKYLVKELSQVVDYQDVAVLYRNNSSSINLINAFDRADIPFYIKDSDNRFFSHWVVEDILNFMRLTFNDVRVDIFEKIYMKMNGYVTKQQMFQLKTLKKKQSVFDNLIETVNIKEYQVEQLKRCKHLFKELRGQEPLEAIRVIRYQLGYEKSLKKMCERLGFNFENLVGILNTLEDIAYSLESMEEFAHRLKYLESIMKTSKMQKNHNVVTLSTFHSSKGLEFKRVFMIDLIDGTIPSKAETKSFDEGKTEQMEEAVRLFYVGMTRAELQLEMLTYKEKNGANVVESSFVTNVRSIVYPPAEIQEKEVTVKKNAAIPINPNAIRNREQLEKIQKVKHRVFGRGEILALEKDNIEIRFKAGIKKLSVFTCIEMGLLEPR